jgi:hypothetical protein
MELTVVRYDPPKAGSGPTGKKTTACRLVVSRAGITDLINRMQNLKAALVASGALTQQGTPTQDPPKPTHH